MRPGLLGKQLIERKLINEDQLRIALHEQNKKHRPLGRILHDFSFLSDETIHDVLAEQRGMRRLPREIPVDTANPAIPEALARRLACLPVRHDPVAKRLELAISETQALPHIDEIRQLLGGYQIDLLLASPGEVARGQEKIYGHQLSIDEIVAELDLPTNSSGRLREGPAIRLADALLNDAVRRQASDLHLEPEANSLRLRYRIDGLMQTIRVLPKSCWPQLCGRIKVLAGMNIAESRAPQDGRIGIRVDGREIDLRVASQPTVNGENIVLRILDRHKGIVPLEKLGMPSPALASLLQILERPDGLLLVCGPTGSGKTTTLYSVIKRLDSDAVNIMTLEDPVEYPLPGIRQTSLSDSLKMDFAGGIRSMLRQDPDIMLIGEIRDPETAQMGIRAALTGHRVLATLHAGDALSALNRLNELGLDGLRLQGCLSGIVAQRLIRRLCPNCRQLRECNARERALLHQEQTYEAKGCHECGGKGYRGRLALSEVLRITPALDDLIGTGATLPQVRVQALGEAYLPMHLAALAMIRQGLSTFAEIGRVIGLAE